MAGHAKSILSKKREKSRAQEEALKEVVALYTNELAKPEDEQRILQAVCADVQAKWWQQCRDVTVAVETVRCWAKGGRGHQEAGLESQGWLTLEEEELVVKYCLELTARGFPFNHRTLKYHVDSILQAHLGDAFPEAGVGTNWTNHFLSRHDDQLGRYWSSPLKAKHGHVDTITKQGIEPDCIWAADETGFQPGTGVKE
ncbi:hypothetical protein M404DRAFT_109526, partial [Pisolithus tinctorius Marx 270]